MDERFPLFYQIICIILTALFVWSFVIAREPRQWRRLYQSMFSRAEDFSVNKNKEIDETLKKYGIIISMIFLVADVGFFLWGASYQDRKERESLSVEEKLRIEEQQKIQGATQYMPGK
jgi:uroporphyrinogen-III decarboxylase